MTSPPGPWHQHLVSVPGVLSLSRAPLAVAFVAALPWPTVALAILMASGLTDVADGWWARRYGQVSTVGAVLDPITDKGFVAAVAIALVVTARLTVGQALLLGTRELGEAPLVVWLLLRHEARKARADRPAANLLGKLATVGQFAAVGSSLYRWPFTVELVLLAGILGAVAAVGYWSRELKMMRGA